MPTMAARPCRRLGCSTLVSDGSGFCCAHQGDRKIHTFSDPFRGSRHERGYGSAWTALRSRVLVRDQGLCQVCLCMGRVSVAKQVDHIKAKSAGGTDDMSNLQAICVACHKVKTATEAHQGRGRSKL